jgi:glycerol-3-phosphate acyltransferase PlsY
MSILGTSIAALVIIALAVTERVPTAYAVFAVIAAPLIIVLHRDNIGRLRAGAEPRIGQGGDKRAPAKKYAPSGGGPR